MKILISGASGLIGQYICRYLKETHDQKKTKSSLRIVALTHRKRAQKIPHTDRQIFWRPELIITLEKLVKQTVGEHSQLSQLSSPKTSELEEAMQECDILIHLAGVSVAGRIPWTPAYKKKILQSQIWGTRLLVKIILQNLKNGHPVPRKIVAASAAGFYGHSTTAARAQEKRVAPLMEEGKFGQDFLARVCRLWEAEWQPLQKKKCCDIQILRFAPVLCPLDQFGFLQGLLGTAARFRTAVSFAWGWSRKISVCYSWIHILDLARFVKHLLETSPSTSSESSVAADAAISPIAMQNKKGTAASFEIFNVGTPYPTNHKEIYQLYASFRKKILVISLPARAVQAIAGDMSGLLLADQLLNVKKMMGTGFEWRYADIKKAMENLLSRSQ